MILLHVVEVVVCYDPEIYENKFRVEARLPQHVNEVKRSVMLFPFKYVPNLKFRCFTYKITGYFFICL